MEASIHQTAFSGGIKGRYDIMKKPVDSYALLFNGRHRSDRITPVNAPLKNKYPEGKLQHVLGVGAYQFIVVSGNIWYRNLAANTDFIFVPGDTLDTTAKIYSVLIPNSTTNYNRTLDSGGKIAFTNEQITQSDSGILFMDGVAQAVIVTINNAGSVVSRRVGTYGSWKQGNITDASQTNEFLREYVPIGILPLWTGTYLWIIGRDSNGNYTQILRSVPGRPLDFVINITTSGDKGGNAFTTAQSVGSESIVSLANGPTQGSVIISTARQTFFLEEDQDNVRFGVPDLVSTPLFFAGCVGPKAFVDILGDYAFITSNGIQSLNIIKQLKIASNNQPFAVDIAKYLSKTQLNGCAINFDDYALFSLDTIFGPALAVFDTTTQAWVGFDLYTGIDRIEEFTDTYEGTNRRLWARTTDGLLIELLPKAGDAANVRFYFGEVSLGTSDRAIVPREFLATFTNIIGDVFVRCTSVVDGVLSSAPTYHKISRDVSLDNSNAVIPYDFNPSAKNRTIQSSQSVDTAICVSYGVLLDWVGHASLIFASALYDTQSWETSYLALQQFANDNSYTPTTVAFIADSSPSSPMTKKLNTGLVYTSHYAEILSAIVRNDIKVLIGGGDHLYPVQDGGKLDEYEYAFGKFPKNLEFRAVAGNHDLDSDGGQLWFARISGSSYYTYKIGLIEFFFVSAGYDTAHIGLDPETRITPAPNLEPAGNTEDSKQALWIKAKMQKSTARYKIIVVHTPPYSSGDKYYPGNTRLRWPYKSWGASAVLSGHEHNYQRFQVDGLDYIICGCGGRDLNKVDPALNPTGLIKYHDTSFGWLRLKADHFSLLVEFIDSSGFVHDRHTIN
jgi:hypothetical protein